MAAKAILHMLSTLKHMSPFDVNMAVDAGYDVAIPYTNVTIDEVSALVQDAMFSRAPSAALRTGIFFAGRDAVLALDMMDTAKKALLKPFEVSLFADPYGSFTTAGAMVAGSKSMHSAGTTTITCRRCRGQRHLRAERIGLH